MPAQLRYADGRIREFEHINLLGMNAINENRVMCRTEIYRGNVTIQDRWERLWIINYMRLFVADGISLREARTEMMEKLKLDNRIDPNIVKTIYLAYKELGGI